MNYIFKYRRGWFWKSIKAIGHKYEESQEKMVVYLANGGVQEIKQWKNCEVKLGSDWYVETKKQMEKEAGHKIPMEIGAN